jgi:glutamate synthase (NADPH/NADH) small chain
MAELSNKERMKLPKQEMPLHPGEERVKNFGEVPIGYSNEMAKQEALRCIQCKNPGCVPGCPVGIDIPGFIQLIEDGDYAGAVKKIRETNFLPSVCGRVCPQDKQCQLDCIVGKKGDPVEIGSLERFVADYEDKNNLRVLPDIAPDTGKKVAVIGAGPAGMTAAYELRKRGHEVTVFEAFHRGGGVLVYGIPRFRLPLETIDADLKLLEDMGVDFVYNMIIGRVLTIDDLLGEEGFDSVFIGTGAGTPKMLGIPGENANGVYSANEYLTRIYLMGANEFPKHTTPIVQGKKVAVVGAGNTAMDSMRTAKRMGADVTCYYRRAKEQAPARTEEVHHADQEFINWKFLSNPVEIISDEKNNVTGVKCEKMELGEPDSSGRRKPVGTGEFFTDKIDTLIFSLGCAVNPILPMTDKELSVNKWGIMMVDETTYQTARKGVFAAGDTVTGGSTVILAMGQAKTAAGNMDKYLKGEMTWDTAKVPTDPTWPGIIWDAPKPGKKKKEKAKAKA